MYKVALSGLIGSGKTTVTEIFSTLGIPCYISDIKAKQLMVTSLRDKIENLLGKEAFTNDRLNKQYISQHIFRNSFIRNELNNIVHPAVKDDFMTWAESQKSEYVIMETALLYEARIDSIVDKIIVVTADIDTRIERVMKRDNASKELVISKINSQTSCKNLLDKADYVIRNDDRNLVITQVLEIDNNIKNLLK